MKEALIRDFKRARPAVDFCALRYYRESSESIHVRQDVLQPIVASEDAGVMVTVSDGGGEGYAATSDLSLSGLKRAFATARDWAHQAGGNAVPRTHESGAHAYASPVLEAWDSLDDAAKIELVRAECARLKIDDRIVDWDALVWRTEADAIYKQIQAMETEKPAQLLLLVRYCHLSV